MKIEQKKVVKTENMQKLYLHAWKLRVESDIEWDEKKNRMFKSCWKMWDCESKEEERKSNFHSKKILHWSRPLVGSVELFFRTVDDENIQKLVPEHNERSHFSHKYFLIFPRSCSPLKWMKLTVEWTQRRRRQKRVWQRRNDEFWIFIMFSLHSRVCFFAKFFFASLE